MPVSNRKLDYVILDLIESSNRNLKTMPLNLGGTAGAGGGVGGPPGGFIGTLPQTRVAYDYDELASSGIPASGMSLLDNLNHIRFRLDDLEASSGGGAGTITVIDDNSVTSYTSTDTIHFSGDGLTVIDLGGGDVQVVVEATVSGVAGSGASEFIELTDTPSSYTGHSGKLVVVNEGETAVEFLTPPYLTDAPSDGSVYGRQDGSWVAVSGAVTGSGGGGGSQALNVSFAESTTEDGQDYNRTSGGTYTSHTTDITLYNPIKLNQVKWDLSSANTYTLKIYRGWDKDDVYANLGDKTTTGREADVTWTGGDLLMMPGKYAFEISWTGNQVVDDNTLNAGTGLPVSFQFYELNRTRYNATVDNNYSAAIRLVAYIGLEELVSVGGGTSSGTFLNLTDTPATYSGYGGRYVTVADAEDGLEFVVTGGGWNAYSDVIPTRSSADDPTYVISFASVDITDKISVGMKVRWTQNSTIRYGIVTAIAFSTNTTVTIYGGTDYNVDDTATYAISDFYYSGLKTPHNFPMNPDLWTVKVTNTSNNDQTSPTASTWYNVGSVSIDIPIGAWTVIKDCLVRVLANTASVSSFSIRSTLSTGTTTNSDNEFHSVTVVSLPIDSAAQQWNSHYKEKNLVLTSKTTYYLNVLTGLSGATSLGIYGNTATTIVKAVCAYL